ncbi:MAG: hypothetical protein C0501_06095 [Isosphaera sp.]|nr:hypothetical protein [Isosphaera sp.]
MPGPITLAPPTPPRRRWPRRLAAAAVLLLVAVWFAPAVVANTSLRNRLARSAAADLNGTVEVGAASLGWFSPVELRDVTLTDARGRVVARIPKVTSGKRLASLLWDRSDPGEFTFDRPAVEVVCGADGTNVEDVFRTYLADDGKPTGPTRTPVALKVVGGTVTVRDAATGKAGEVRDLDATVRVPASRAEPVAVAASANAPGRVEVDAALGPASRAKVTAAGVALETAAPFLRRLDPTVTAAGSLSAGFTAAWGDGAAAVEGTVGVKDLAVTAPALDGETLRLASAELPLKVAVAGRAVRVDRADLTCDVGAASVAGTFDPAEPLDRLLVRPGVRLGATVDVAKLAAALPKLLRVRDGTAFREGKLTVKAESTAGPAGTAWAGGVTTSAVKAVRDGREIVWDEPLAVEFAATVRAGEWPTFDRLTCKSDFVAVNAEVKPDSVRAAANVYLDRLAARLADFVDLQGVGLDGQGSVRLVVRRAAGGAFTAEAGAELKRFALTDRTGKGLREPDLKVQLTASGTAPDGGPVGVSAATLALAAGADELRLSLVEPITDAKNLTAGAVDARLAGDLGRWRSRAALVTSALDGYQVGGTATARGVVRFGPGVVKADRLTVEVDNIRFVGAGLDIAEPRLDAVADLTVNRAAGTATFADFTVTSAPLSVTRGTLVVEAPAAGPLVVRGSGPAVTDLNRLGKSVGAFDPDGPSAMRGRGAGPVRFLYAGDVTTFGGALDVTNFAFGPKAAPEWTEPVMRVELDGSYTRSTDTVAFTAAKVDRPGLGLTAKGSVGKFDTTTDADLAGTVSYDWAQLTQKLRELLGGEFVAAGRGSKPFRLVGSLTPPARPGSRVPPSPLAGLTADVAVGWDAARAYGFDLGPAEVRAALANGVARVSPVSATFGGGKVTLEPTVRLEPGPGEVTFAKGRVVDRAKLTPAATAGALGYALPAVANAAKAAGEVSVDLGDNRVPLSDPRKASVRGTVHVHSATLTAGPVMGVIAKLLGDDDAAMTLANEQAVPVRVENGRVYHEGLAIKVGAYLVRTSGSAGFDGTLDLVADVPVPGGLANPKTNPVLAKALAGKRVAVPVRGTLGQPAVDGRAFQAAVAALARDAAKDAGKELLNKELEKFLQGAMPGAGGGKPGGLFPFPFPKK